MLHIESPANPRIKQLLKLQKPALRKSLGVFTVEGIKELTQCINAGYIIQELFVCPEIAPAYTNFISSWGIVDTNICTVTKRVFDKIAYRENSAGYIAVVKNRLLGLADIRLKPQPLIIVLESIEKPGNLGAILRTADAAQVDAVIVCDPKTDLFNPNIIRSSLGGIFSNQVVCCSNDACLKWLLEHHFNIAAAALNPDAIRYDKVDFTAPTALVFGTEANGLTEFWLRQENQKIIIPMLGKLDSLNVSGSCAIVLFEAMRQRNFKLMD